jgi:Protein of unknown function (DUF3800)
MAHSFVAYIDESGDEGFIFSDPPARASSEWFILSALVVPGDTEVAALRQIDAVMKPIEQGRGSIIHFHKLNHDQRVAMCTAIGESRATLFSILIDKRRLNNAWLQQGYNLYFYATRYLLERISWFARDEHEGNPAPIEPVKLVFSNRAKMSYDDLRAYVARLRRQETSIYWPAIDPAHLVTKTPKDRVGLRMVDCVASGFSYGLELSRLGFFEARYGECMAPRVYSRGGRHRPYGMKFFPDVPPVEPQWRDRYAWVHRAFPK